MGIVAQRNRRQRRLHTQRKKENKHFKKFKKQAKYGSKLHRHRISQGILARIYGRPIRGKYNKPRYKPRRVAGYNAPSRSAGVFYFRQRKSKRKARDGR